MDNALVEVHKGYKYFQKNALRFQLWPSFSRLILNFNENASFLEVEFRLRVHFKKATL